jgi:hypothetical protein
MKNLFRALCAIFGTIMMLESPAITGNTGAGHGEGGHGGGAHGGGYEHREGYHGGQSGQVKGHEEMEHPGMNGTQIHSSIVDGYKLSYELIDMRERMKDMPNMPEMPGTHHLMVYVQGPDGSPAENAKTGFLIQGPDGEKQTAMCVGMGGGYGADIKLDKKGTYTIKSKIVNGNDKVLDLFTHQVK